MTRTGWWSTARPEGQVAAFFRTHAPVGMRHPIGEDVVYQSSPGVWSTEYDVLQQADPAAYTGPALLVQFRQIGDHIVLRADTFLAARFAVPADHRISDTVVSVRIDRVRPGAPNGRGPGGLLPSVTLTRAHDAAQITHLVRGFNALNGSVTRGGFLSCPFPGSPAPSDVVTFHRAAGMTVRARLSISCWGQIEMSVDGSRLPLTLDRGSWDGLVNDIADAAR